MTDLGALWMGSTGLLDLPTRWLRWSPQSLARRQSWLREDIMRRLDGLWAGGTLTSGPLFRSQATVPFTLAARRYRSAPRH